MGKSRCRYVASLSIVSAVMFWPAEAWMASTYFNSGTSFIGSLLTPDPQQVWVRSLVILLFLALAYVCMEFLSEAEQQDNISKRQKDFTPTSSNRRYVEEQTKLRALAYRDYLTGLYNRRRIEELLEAMYQTEQLKHSGLAVLFCDIDYFKRVNTRYGHPAGDEVLTKLADVFRQHFRRGDAVGRWGGEEFLIILANLNLDEAEEIAEALRKRVEAETFPHVGKLTISIGLSMLQPGEGTDDLIRCADRALRQAKFEGRNCWRYCKADPEPLNAVIRRKPQSESAI